MASFLHLLKGDSGALAAPVIDATLQSGAEVTVVLLDGARPPALPPAVQVRRLGTGDLDYSGLLDLVFASDHVISW
jgi:hypothetical protein